MPILNVQTNQIGQAGVFPAMVFILTNDTLAQVTATGYLNGVTQKFQIPLSESDIALVTTKTSPNSPTTSVGWFGIAVSNGNWSLTGTTGEGTVVLPTIANHLATYTNTLGTLSEDPATAISGGNIQAGLSGTAGYLASFPATMAKGSLQLVAASSAGDTVTTITNASQAAARTYTIPDGGASSSFLLTNSGGTQTIATGNLTLTLGNLLVSAGSITATAGAISAGTTLSAGTTIAAGTGISSTTGNIVAVAGNVTAGSDAHAGVLTSFPATTANGSLIVAAVNAGAAHNTTISNGVMGQATVYTLGDIGAATGGIVVATTDLRMKAVSGSVVTGGAAAQTITDAFCTTGSIVTGNWNTQANAVSVLTIVPGNGSFVVTSSGDPGSSTFNYIITK